MPRDFVGSIITANPSGLTPGVLYLLNDATNLIWTKGGAGGDSVVDLDASAGFTSAKGLRILPRTTSAAEGDTVNASLECALGLGKYVSCRFRYTLSGYDSIDYWYLKLWVDTGVRGLRTEIRIDPLDNEVEYLNSAGAFVNAPNQAQSGTNDRWGYLSIDLNLIDFTYRNLVIDGFDQGIDGVSFHNYEASALKYLSVTLGLKTLDDAVPGLYVDNMIIVDQANI